MFAPLLDSLADAGVDLSRTVITVDAHSTPSRPRRVPAPARRGVRVHRQAESAPPVRALDALPWAQLPIACHDVDTGHDRVTTRTIQVLPAPAGLPFPHVNQVWLIERYTCDPAGKPPSAVAAMGVTNLTTDHADPTKIATLVRNHWGIESLH